MVIGQKLTLHFLASGYNYRVILKSFCLIFNIKLLNILHYFCIISALFLIEGKINFWGTVDR
jgi:hypothetical protein